MNATPSKSNAKVQLNRRDFLDLAWKGLLALSGLLGLGGLLRFFSYQPKEENPQEVDLGPTEDFAPGSITPIPSQNAIVLHDEKGLRAFSTICPHLGCVVSFGASGFTCPCHGSKFDMQGNSAGGPAKEDLQPLRLRESPEGHLFLQTGSNSFG